MGKALGGVTITDGEVVGRTVSLKIAASGAVTATGNFLYSAATYKATCATTLCFDGATYTVPVYFPPKSGKFDGYSEVYVIDLDEMAIIR